MSAPEMSAPKMSAPKMSAAQISSNNALIMRELDQVAFRLPKIQDEIELLATTSAATPYIGQIEALQARAVTMESRFNELDSLFNQLNARTQELKSPINSHPCAVKDNDKTSSETKEQPETTLDLETAVRKASLTNTRKDHQPIVPLRDHSSQLVPDSASDVPDFKQAQEEVNALAKAILSGADGDRDSKMRQFGIPKL